MSSTRSSDAAIAIDELAAARAELARLQDCERELLEELGSVRAAVRVQRGKIDDLFKQRRLPAPITRLPPTVLSDIIYRVILDTHPESDAHRCTKRQLASVSRLWRDAILGFPDLWTTIAIDPSWSISLVMAHVDRSGECPLDIIISNWSSYSDSFNDLIGVAVTCGYRWRTLVIQQIGGKAAVQQLVKSIWKMRFPSLECVKIFGVQTSDNPPFLTSRYAPTLKHLTLCDQDRIDELQVNSNLEVGHFHLSGRNFGSQPLSPLLSCQQLRKLVLSGSSGLRDQWPEPRSINFPALASLTLNLADPYPALAAMVAPNLSYLRCSRARSWAPVFGDFPDVFTNVRHLHLIDAKDGNAPFESSEADVRAVCAACPGVRHVELLAEDISAFFKPNTTADRWLHLEHLTLKGLRVGVIPHGLIQWLDERNSWEQSLLRVTLSEFRVPESASDGPWLTTLCESLRGRCLFELKDFPLRITLKAHTSSQGVCTCAARRCDAHNFTGRMCWNHAEAMPPWESPSMSAE
ncbi:hypothetical protein EDD16DRAFT_1612377 [Pisolithus croceorrhizus]|nr:hypothetical protein EDD16DRAFT_1612377 [Pisolithus croceorrhizus]